MGHRLGAALRVRRGAWCRRFACAPRATAAARALRCGGLVSLLVLLGALPAPGGAWAAQRKAAQPKPPKLVVVRRTRVADGDRKRVAGDGAGRIHLKLLGSAASDLYTDGERLAVYEPVAGVTRIIDTETHRTFDRADPTGCARGLIAFGGGELLYACTDSECPKQEDSCENTQYATARFVVEDIHSSAQHRVVGERRLPASSGGLGEFLKTELLAIGKQWVKGRLSAMGEDETFYLNWHTGQLVVYLFEDISPNEREGLKVDRFDVEDLSSSKLLKSLCKPLSRTPNLKTSTNLEFIPMLYAPPFAVQAGDGSSMHLMRCDAHGSEAVLVGAPAEEVEPTELQIGAGILSWLGTSLDSENLKDTMYLTHLDDHGSQLHGKIYQLIGPEVGAQNMLLQHTVSTVYESVREESSSSKPSSSFHIYTAQVFNENNHAISSN